jgi:hypothetical protein
MLGGSIAVAALGAIGSTADGRSLAARFVGVALMAAAGAVAMPLLAPSTLRVEPADALGAAAE